MTSILHHKHRLQGQLTRKTAADEQEAMRYSKLSKWERTKHGMKDTLNDFRRKFRLLLSQPLPKNATETEQRINDTAVSMNWYGSLDRLILTVWILPWFILILKTFLLYACIW